MLMCTRMYRNEVSTHTCCLRMRFLLVRSFVKIESEFNLSAERLNWQKYRSKLLAKEIEMCFNVARTGKGRAERINSETKQFAEIGIDTFRNDQY